MHISSYLSEVRTRKIYSTKRICCEFVGELKQDIEVITTVQKGHAQLLFISPESLLSNPQWRDMLLLPVYQNKVVALIVDEAHCIAMWYVSLKSEHPYNTRQTRALQAKRTRFGPRVNALHTRSERVSYLVRMRFTRTPNAKAYTRAPVFSNVLGCCT